ncbi:MAG TPA: DMT family transporter [Terriglobales bacterium]|nr:DMT family transporter [Terriglobales bacterium]
MPVKAHTLRGYLYIAAAALCFGISATLGRAAFTGRLLAGAQGLRSIEPVILAQTRTTFSLLLLAPFLLWRRGREGMALPRADFVGCLVLGVLGVAGSNYLYYFAIQKLNVAVAIILQYTAPVWVLLYMVARGRQRATGQRVSAVALAVIGCGLAIGIVGAGRFNLNSWGLSAALAGAFTFAFYNIAGHDLLTRHDHWRILVYVLLGSALFWLLVNPPWKIAAARYTAAEWLFLLVFAVVSVLVPYLFYFAGLRHLDATRAIVTSCLEPVFSIVIAAIALGELVRPVQVAGIALVLVATVLVQLPSTTDAESAILEPVE